MIYHIEFDIKDSPESLTVSHIIVAALYKFASLPDFQALQAPLLDACISHGLKGTLLLADEGINGTVAGSREGIDGMLAYLKSDPRLADLEHKESFADENAVLPHEGAAEERNRYPGCARHQPQ